MIFDLAHLIRLVGRSYNYEPFIGWMLALPGDEWLAFLFIPLALDVRFRPHVPHAHMIHAFVLAFVIWVTLAYIRGFDEV